MSEDVPSFYDELAAHYHLLFADWRASMARQAAALDRLLRRELGPGPHAIRDVACGIGTQAIGLAALGHRLHASDLSPAAVARARREAAATSGPLAITFSVADLRNLGEEDGAYDVVLAADNALPHCRDEGELRRAVASMAGRLRPGGLFLASIRDYDQLLRERPRGEGPRILTHPETGQRRMSFQVWEWRDDRRYRLHQVLLLQEDAGWRGHRFRTGYRALPRAELTDALRGAALTNIRWHEPAASGFFQPIVTARKRAGRAE